MHNIDERVCAFCRFTDRTLDVIFALSRCDCVMRRNCPFFSIARHTLNFSPANGLFFDLATLHTAVQTSPWFSLKINRIVRDVCKRAPERENLLEECTCYCYFHLPSYNIYIHICYMAHCNCILNVYRKLATKCAYITYVMRIQQCLWGTRILANLCRKHSNTHTHTKKSQIGM